MRKYDDVAADFIGKLDAIGPKPDKKYIAYNAGNVFHTDDYSVATAFAAKGMIETIVPDPAALADWRSKKYAIVAEISAQWKKELFAEFGLSNAISQKILDYTENHCDSPDDQADKFEGLAYLVDDCIKLAAASFAVSSPND